MMEATETIVETDSGTETVGAREHQTTEAIDGVKEMTMPTLPAETIVTVSARIDTRGVRDEAAIANGTAIEDHPVEMLDATTTNDPIGETETLMMTAVEEAGTDARTYSQRSKYLAVQARRPRSESQLQI